MLWIALVCPELPLDRILRRWPEALAPGVAVTRTPRARARCILLASPIAQQAGVRAGLDASTALALLPELLLIEEDPAADAATLRELALCALRYTPQVVVREGGLLLEVGASLRLFGGLDGLHAGLLASMQASGIGVQAACASTAHGAWLLARARHAAPTAPADFPAPTPPVNLIAPTAPVNLPAPTPPADLAAALDRLPLAVLDHAAQLSAATGMGCRSIGDLRKLPRAGVAERFGEAVLAELDRAFGRRAEPQDWFVAPQHFHAAFEFADATLCSATLLAVSTRLLDQLAGWLHARQVAIREFSLTLIHPSRPARPQAPSVVALRLAEPAQDAAHFADLLRERLARLALPAPVQSVKLATGAVVDWQAAPRDLFTRPGVADESLGRLIEALQARLGADAVTRVYAVDDHRPEHALQRAPAHEAHAPAKPGAAKPGMAKPGAAKSSAAKPTSAAKTSAAKTRAATTDPLASQPGTTPPVATEPVAAQSGTTQPVTGPRPCWLLAAPQALAMQQDHPVYESPLHWRGGAERIEAGWWDDAWTARDYYVAQNAAGCRFWIFRERSAAEARPVWYLHGIFG